MEWYLYIKVVHIISSTILFGTGIGIAFFMWWAHCTGDIHAKAFAARTTVLADFAFTTPAIITQMVTGGLLTYILGYDTLETWLVVSYVLYFIAGACWLPVVWIQIQLRKMALTSLNDNVPLPDRYHKLYYVWFALGWPAFIGLVIVFFLMVFRPIL